MPKEKDFQQWFSRWAKTVYRQTGAFELKLCRYNSLPFNALAEHQKEALLNAKHGALCYKIPDIGLGQKPMDCFCLAGVPSYVVIRYASGVTYLIDIDDYVLEWDRSSRKSLTEAAAAGLSTITLDKQLAIK